MHFSGEITLGTLIEAATFLGGALVIARKFGAIETKLNIMYGWFNTEVINGHAHREDRMLETQRFYGKHAQHGAND